jgi:hypothetical protein
MSTRRRRSPARDVALGLPARSQHTGTHQGVVRELLSPGLSSPTAYALMKLIGTARATETPSYTVSRISTPVALETCGPEYYMAWICGPSGWNSHPDLSLCHALGTEASQIRDTCAALAFCLVGVDCGQSQLPPVKFIHELPDSVIDDIPVQTDAYSGPTDGIVAIMRYSIHPDTQIFNARVYPKLADAETDIGSLRHFANTAYTSQHPQKLDISFLRRYEASPRAIGSLLASQAFAFQREP